MGEVVCPTTMVYFPGDTVGHEMHSPLLPRKEGSRRYDGRIAEFLWKFLIVGLTVGLYLWLVVFIKSNVLSQQKLLRTSSESAISVKYAALSGIKMEKNPDGLVLDMKTSITLDSRVFLPVHVTSSDLKIFICLSPEKSSLYMMDIVVDTTIPISSKNSEILIPFKFTNINKPALKLLIDLISNLNVGGEFLEFGIFLKGSVGASVLGLFRTHYSVDMDITSMLFPPDLNIDDSCIKNQLHISVEYKTPGFHIYSSEYAVEYYLSIPNISVLRIGDPNILVNMSFFSSEDQTDKIFTLSYKTGINSLSLPCNILKTNNPESDESLSLVFSYDEKLQEIINGTSDQVELIVSEFILSYIGQHDVANYFSELLSGLSIPIMAEVDKQNNFNHM